MQKENKQLELEKLLIAKIRDKESMCKMQNKITYTDFLDIYQKSVILKEIKNNDEMILFGGYEGADREILLFYPDKITRDVAQNYFDKLLKVIKIQLPRNHEKYPHGVYLSGVMKIGLEREKFGDIIVTENGADILVFSENASYIKDSLAQLKRFRKSIIDIQDITGISNRVDEYEDISVMVPSMRVDNFVAEIARISRKKASEYIDEGKIFINSSLVLKSSKMINLEDVLTIRGKGKYIVSEVIRKTEKREICYNSKKEKIKVRLLHYAAFQNNINVLRPQNKKFIKKISKKY